MSVFNPCTAELLCGSRGSLKIGNAHKSEIPGSAYKLHWLETLDLNTFQFVKIKLLYDQETCEMNSTQDCYYHVTNWQVIINWVINDCYLQTLVRHEIFFYFAKIKDVQWKYLFSFYDKKKVDKYLIYLGGPAWDRSQLHWRKFMVLFIHFSADLSPGITQCWMAHVIWNCPSLKRLLIQICWSLACSDYCCFQMYSKSLSKF